DRDLGQLVLRPGLLGRPAATPLVGQDLPVDEQLATPDPPGLPALQGALQARDQRRARRADVLGPGNVLQFVTEEQLVELASAVVAAGVGPPGGVADGKLRRQGVGLTVGGYVLFG